MLSQIGILSIIDSIGALFGPIAGIMIADYYLLKNLNDHWENLTEDFLPSFNGVINAVIDPLNI